MRLIKIVIFWFDGLLLKGRLRRYRESISDDRFFSKIESELDGKIVINYTKNKANELAALCDKYDSDKGSNLSDGHPYPWSPHSYADFYTMLFQHRRNEVSAVFECGIGTSNKAISANMGPDGRPGASLRVWKEYFPNANIYGADIDKSILFEESRIKTFFMDQTNALEICETFENIGNILFDVIIDDGLHTFDAGRVLFESAWSRIAPGGVYIIEDVGRGDFLAYKRYFESTEFRVAYVSLKRRSERFGDNNLIMISNCVGLNIQGE
jgi:SAM-dependent methyltransferase